MSPKPPPAHVYSSAEGLLMRTLLRLDDEAKGVAIGYALDLLASRANLGRDSTRRTLKRLVAKGVVTRSESTTSGHAYYQPDPDAIRVALGLKTAPLGPRVRLSSLAARLAS